jgi:hypothetical protein
MKIGFTRTIMIQKQSNNCRSGTAALTKSKKAAVGPELKSMLIVFFF